MGVPSYFGWIMKQTKKFGLQNMLHHRLTNATKRLYLDFNCLIHRACREAKNAQSETDLIKSVINVMAQVIGHVNPLELVYIAIDGSVPMGKCKQQRFRRFKSVKENYDIEKIYQYHNLNRDKPFFDFNAISPGTEFMNHLADAIKEYIESQKGKGINIILSDSHQPGEGEHKIMHHIKENPVATNDQIVIYGLDADLIFLSLSLHHTATYLFRENLYNEKIDNVIPEYLYLHIGDLRDSIIQLVVQTDDIIQLPTTIGKYYISEITDYDSDRIINDYIFFNYFLGNDFVNRIYSLQIRGQGCETVMQVYRFCLRRHNDYLINASNNKIIVNLSFLKEFMIYLAEYEEYWWLNPPKVFTPKVAEGLSDVERDVELYGIIDRYLSDIDLRFGDEDFKYNYYRRLFHLDNSKSLDENIKIICQDYWKTIYWTLQYYFNDCLDWDWYYPYEYAPLIDDLINYIDTVNNVTFNSSGAIDVYHQLMIILPPSSFNLLPKRYHHILENGRFRKYYPNNFEYNYYGNRFLWECSPKIHILDSKQTRDYYNYLNRH